MQQAPSFCKGAREREKGDNERHANDVHRKLTELFSKCSKRKWCNRRAGCTKRVSRMATESVLRLNHASALSSGS